MKAALCGLFLNGAFAVPAALANPPIPDVYATSISNLITQIGDGQPQAPKSTVGPPHPPPSLPPPSTVKTSTISSSHYPPVAPPHPSQADLRRPIVLLTKADVCSEDDCRDNTCCCNDELLDHVIGNDLDLFKVNILSPRYNSHGSTTTPQTQLSDFRLNVSGPSTKTYGEMPLGPRWGLSGTLFDLGQWSNMLQHHHVHEETKVETVQIPYKKADGLPSQALRHYSPHSFTQQSLPNFAMIAKSIITVLTLAAAATATLDPATSNTKGKYPSSPGCSATKVSKDIQAAECSHNTRVSGTQTFAIFTVDHSHDSSHGAPYGTCEAYTCAPGTAMKSDSDTWTFFWSNAGAQSGEGAGCIKSPDDGTCGCEDSDGAFIAGSSSCS
ncbi:MAG: hypothetical protein Q9162_006542 [Coniocarpon cinnabarinum]